MLESCRVSEGMNCGSYFDHFQKLSLESAADFRDEFETNLLISGPSNISLCVLR
jgi:hypothetical protein